MKLLAISEHYYPRVGGTVNYVHETLSALAEQGVTVELLVPGPEPKHWQPYGMTPPSYKVTWIDAGYAVHGDPSRNQRYLFCEKVNDRIAGSLNGPNRPDVIHVLFGLFVMEILNTCNLCEAGVPTLATVHNVPPMECCQTMPDAALPALIKETLRLSAVKWKNRSRLRRHRYDVYIVPSNQVKKLLSPIVESVVKTIGHGLTSDLQSRMVPPLTRRPEGALQLLTVGGYAPHKRQHIIPEAADKLRASGVDFQWDVVGPPGRVPRYCDTIKHDILSRGLTDQVKMHEAVSFNELARLYDQANLYVQPSIEEGFCLTGLDAAAAGLPVIGSNAGALPDIVKASGGVMVRSDPAALAQIIFDFKQGDCWEDPKKNIAAVHSRFSWQEAARSLCANYEALLANARTNA